jgi:methylmalonyl-CoA mutase cobalamin-binding subunit
MTGHALDGVLSDADIALAAALSVAVPSMIAGDAMEKAPGMIDHLRAQGFDVVRQSDD